MRSDKKVSFLLLSLKLDFYVKKKENKKRKNISLLSLAILINMDSPDITVGICQQHYLHYVFNTVLM